MKIRWTKDSVRFRITPSELATLQRGEVIQESFSVNNWWRAAISPAARVTELQFESGVVLVSLSDNDLASLSNPENEGVYFQTEDEAPIRYLIEKDFPCANPRPVEAMEPETETFPAPSNFEARKAK